MSRDRLIALGAARAVLLAGCVVPADGSPGTPPVDDEPVATAASAYSVTCPGYNPYKNVYFGDLHSHTSYSFDAYNQGTRSDPWNAYAFAKGQASVAVGQATTALPGPTITQPRRLDFLAVTDHSESLAIEHGCTVDPNSGYYNTADCGAVRSIDVAQQSVNGLAVTTIYDDLCGSGGNPALCAIQKRNGWVDTQNAANGANAPCSFSSFIGYEWTDMEDYFDPVKQTTTQATDHRNVIFAGTAVPWTPLDALDYPNPPALWTGLDQQCTAAMGCDVVTIPHNSNMSGGVSLKIWDLSANGIRQQYQYQVAAEIYQHKGASECDSALPQWAGDAACGFEARPALPSEPTLTTGSFVRGALETGLVHKAVYPTQGNPLRLGIVGATDDHNGAPGYTDEAAFVGHGGRRDDQAFKRLTVGGVDGSGGLTGVWAEQNTRDAVFAALKRRETFATSGPRMRVRFFQTTDATACSDAAFPKKIVDAGAAPMGSYVGFGNIGGLRQRPMFAIEAWPDAYPQNVLTSAATRTYAPGTATIQAVQIIKAHAYVDIWGVPHLAEDAPYPVAACPAGGGCAMWTDPSFLIKEHAVYYVRVLQVPTARWSHNDCAWLAAHPEAPSRDLGLAACNDAGLGLDRSVQERAWSSPIWFTPY